MVEFNQWHIEDITLDLESNTQGSIPVIYGRQGDKDGILCNIELTQRGAVVPYTWFNGKRVYYEARGNGISVRKQVDAIDGNVVKVVIPEEAFLNIGLVNENFLRVEDASTGNTIISATTGFHLYVRQGMPDPNARAFYLQEVEDVVSDFYEWVKAVRGTIKGDPAIDLANGQALLRNYVDSLNLETVRARGSFNTLPQRLLNFDSILNETLGKVNDMDRGWGQTFPTLAALNTAFPPPTGGTKRHVVAADGNWYYYNGSAWVSGGAANNMSIPNNSIKPVQTSFFEPNPDNLIRPNNYTIGYVDHQGVIQPTGASRVNKDIIPLNKNSVYRLQSRYPLTNTTIYMAMYNKDGVFTRRFNVINNLSDDTTVTFVTGENDEGYRLSCIAGDEYDLFLHEGIELLPFEEPFVIAPQYLQKSASQSLVEQTDFVQVLSKHNTSNKPLLAKVIGDRVFWVYQPIAGGKYVGHHFTKDNNDDFVIYASAVIGKMEDNVFTPEQYLMAGSNKEFAFRLRPKGSTADVRWFPEHENVGTVFKLSQSILFDGEEKVGEMSPGQMTEVSSVTLTQVMEMKFPGEAEPVGTITIVTSISSLGVTYNSEVTWLRDVEIERGYVAMLPTVVPPVDTLRTSLGNDYSATLATGVDALMEMDKATSYVYLNKSGTSPNNKYALAQTLLNPESTLRRGQPGRKEPYPIWLEHRTEAIQKLYPQVYLNHNALAGEKFTFGATIFVGILPYAGNILI